MRAYFKFPTLAAIVLGRNVVNVPGIEDFVEKFEQNDPRIDNWLKRNLRNWLIKDYDRFRQITHQEGNPDWVGKALERGEKVYEVRLDREIFDKISHVIDWFKSDDSPKRLDAVTVPEALKQSDAWTEKLTKKKVDQGIALAGEEIFKKYGDGYSWRKLVSEEALVLEGKKMGHCVGGYWSSVQSGETEILSLRDPKNEPHCTVEISHNEVRQIKGKQNKSVIKEYWSYAQDLLKTLKENGVYVGANNLSNIGLYEIDGKIVTFKELVANLDLVKALLKKHFGIDVTDEMQVQVTEDGIEVGSKFVDILLGFLPLPRRQIEAYKNLMEDSYDTEFSIHDHDVTDLYDYVEKHYPKAYKRLVKLLESVATEEEAKNEDYLSHRSASTFLKVYSDELQPIYDAAISGISDGWSVGTQDAAHKYVKDKLSEYGWLCDSYTSEDGDGTVWLHLSSSAIADGYLGDLYKDPYGRRDGFNSEFDEEVAKERFVDALFENGFLNQADMASKKKLKSALEYPALGKILTRF
jgi:hypothetical protein